MKKFVILALTAGVAAASMLMFTASPVEARSKYKKAFYKKYLDENAEYKPTADNKVTGRCWLCHVNMKKQDPPQEGFKKKVRNNYGTALSKYVKENEKDLDKIVEALEKVAADQSDASDDESPTFGELIAEGKLPGDGVPNPDDVKAVLESKE